MCDGREVGVMEGKGGGCDGRKGRWDGGEGCNGRIRLRDVKWMVG